MSDEYLQKDLKPVIYTDTSLDKDNSAEVQSLILGAYLDDKKKWEDKIKEIGIILAKKLDEENKLRELVLKQSKIKIFLYGLFGKKTNQESKLLQTIKEVDKLGEQLTEMSKAPPSVNAYELAIMGNKLFSAR